VDRILGRCCDVGQNRLYDFFFIYFLLTCEFSIWQGFFSYKNVTIQFNAIDHNSKLNCWIELKLYLKISDVFCYVGVKFQVDQILERCYDVGQNRLYDFFYLLPFELWIFYLARILFLQEYDSLFWEFSSSTKMFYGLQHNFNVWQWFINISNSFSY